MFCPQCGKQAVIAGRYCKFCGSYVGVSAEPATAMSHQTSVRSTQIDQATELKRVGGWLLFFCIGSTVIHPLVMLLDFRSSGYVIVDIIDFLVMTFGVVVGIYLWSVSKRALGLLVIRFGISFVTSLLAIALLGLDLAYGKPDVAIRLAGEGVGLLVLFAWIAYFHTSVRVNATFGSNL